MARIESLIEVLDRSKKRIAIAFTLAILLHLPATPVMPVLRLARRLHLAEPPPVSTQPPVPREVEVELREALRVEEQRKEQQAQPPPEPLPSPAAPPPAAVKFAQNEPPKSEPDKAEKPPEPKKERVKDVGLEGMNNKLTGKPGVTLGLWFSSLRDNPLGKPIADLAACDREWKIFVDQGVDLLKDFDGALVVGPELFQPKQLTVAVRHALSGNRVHDVVDGLVKRSGPNGRWIESNLATARLGKTQRMLLPQQADLFFVTPLQGWEALHNAKEPLNVPTAEGRMLSLVLAPPQKALARAGLTLPKRISELRLEVFANPDQSIDVRVELTDSSPDAALTDVKPISAQLHDFFADVWSVATTLGTLTGGGSHEAPMELAPRLDLSVDEKLLTGMIHLSPGQTKTALELATSVLCRKPKRSKAKPEAAK